MVDHAAKLHSLFFSHTRLTLVGDNPDLITTDFCIPTYDRLPIVRFVFVKAVGVSNKSDQITDVESSLWIQWNRFIKVIL